MTASSSSSPRIPSPSVLLKSQRIFVLRGDTSRRFFFLQRVSVSSASCCLN